VISPPDIQEWIIARLRAPALNVPKVSFNFLDKALTALSYVHRQVMGILSDIQEFSLANPQHAARLGQRTGLAASVPLKRLNPHCCFTSAKQASRSASGMRLLRTKHSSTPTPNARLLPRKTERLHHTDPPPVNLIRPRKRETQTRRIEPTSAPIHSTNRHGDPRPAARTIRIQSAARSSSKHTIPPKKETRWALKTDGICGEHHRRHDRHGRQNHHRRHVGQCGHRRNRCLVAELELASEC
jgi:hypothetical protein